MPDYPYEISTQLNPAEQAALEATPVPLGHDRFRSAADLVVGWAAHVTRLYNERELTLEQQRDAWNAYDYIAALVVRGFVDRAMATVDGTLRDRTGAVVVRFDELLRSFTEPDERGVLRRFATDEAGNQWWWERIPRTGPIRRELDDFATHSGPR